MFLCSAPVSLPTASDVYIKFVILSLVILLVNASTNPNTRRHCNSNRKSSAPVVKEVVKKIYVKVPVRVLMPANEIPVSASNVQKVRRRPPKGKNDHPRRKDASKHHIYFHHQFGDQYNRSRGGSLSEEKLLQKLAARLQSQPIDSWGMSESDPLKTALIVLDPSGTSRRRSGSSSNKKKKRPRKVESVSEREQSLKEDEEDYDEESSKPLASESEDEVEEDDSGEDEFVQYLRNRKRAGKKWQSRYNTYQQLQGQKRGSKKLQSEKTKQNKFEEKMVKFILENTSLISSIVSKQNLARCMLQCASSLVHASADSPQTSSDPEQFGNSDQSLLEAAFQSMNLPDASTSFNAFPSYSFAQNPSLSLFKNPLQVSHPVANIQHSQVTFTPPPPPIPTSVPSLHSHSHQSSPPVVSNSGDSIYFTVQRTIKAPTAGQAFSPNSEPSSSGSNLPDLISGSAPPIPAVPESSVFSVNDSYNPPVTAKPVYIVLGNEKPKDSVEQFLSGPFPTVEDPAIDFGMDSNRNSVMMPPNSNPSVPLSIVKNNVQALRMPKHPQTSHSPEVHMNVHMMGAASTPPIATRSQYLPHNSWPFYGANSLSQIVSPPLSSLSRTPQSPDNVDMNNMNVQTLQPSAESASRRLRSQMRKLFDVNSLAILPKVSFGKERL